MIDNLASLFLKSLAGKAQFSKTNEKAGPIKRNKASKFGLGVFQGKVLFLNILRHNFTREAEFN